MERRGGDPREGGGGIACSVNLRLVLKISSQSDNFCLEERESERHTQQMCNSGSQHMIVQLTYTGASGQPYIHYIHPLKLTESSTESMGPYGVTSDLPRSQD